MNTKDMWVKVMLLGLLVTFITSGCAAMPAAPGAASYVSYMQPATTMIDPGEVVALQPGMTNLGVKWAMEGTHGAKLFIDAGGKHMLATWPMNYGGTPAMGFYGWNVKDAESVLPITDKGNLADLNTTSGLVKYLMAKGWQDITTKAGPVAAVVKTIAQSATSFTMFAVVTTDKIMKDMLFVQPIY